MEKQSTGHKGSSGEHKTSIKALSLIESPMNHCQDNCNEWIDDIYHNSLFSFRDLASMTLDYRCTPLHLAYWWWNFWLLCDLIFIIADIQHLSTLHLNVRSAQLNTFSSLMTAVFWMLLLIIRLPLTDFWITKLASFLNTRFTKNFILESVNLSNHNFFQFDSTMWHQLCSRAMGKSLHHHMHASPWVTWRTVLFPA